MAAGGAFLCGTAIFGTDIMHISARAQGLTSPRNGTDGRFRGQYVTVDGRPLFMRVSTGPVPRPDPPLVLVHGLALSGRYMMPTGHALADRYRVYVPDLPGFGDSDKPPRALDVEGLADALAAWMESVGIPRAMLLGNSFGCQVIVDFAARHPDKVARGVLQGPTTPPEERGWIRQFVRWRQNAPFNPTEMEEIAGADYGKCGLVRALLTFEHSLRDRPEDKLAGIAAPMLVVRGALDPICRQPWAEAMTSGLPDGRLEVIPEVAHTLVFTSARELAGVARPFLDQETA